MSSFVAVARVEELPPGTRLHYTFDEETVIVLNVDGEFFAIADLPTPRLTPVYACWTTRPASSRPG